MNIRESKAVAWVAMIIVVALLIVMICLRLFDEVWEYSAIFCAFMMVFCHLMALNLQKMSKVASRKLDLIALIFGGLTVVAIIVVYILGQVV